MLRFATIAALLAATAPLAAQNVEVPTSLPDASSKDDIIITALRIPREKLPTGVYWNYRSLIPSNIARENSTQFFRCALKSSNLKSIKAAVDGEPNSADARFAQGWIRVTHRGCYPPTTLSGYITPAMPTSIADLGSTPVSPTTIADVGGSILDRGVIIESVLKSYAPDAALTPSITADVTVQSRFQQREQVRNRLRLPNDREALVFASCLVRQQPVLATRLFKSSPGSLLERGLTQTIIVEGRECVGQASRITVDPSLMRIYIMDAFYRWVVAARGVDSLLPADT